MGSLELTFPMDSPDKDYVDMSASKEKINSSRKTILSSREDVLASREDVVTSREEEYCLWEPKDATSLPASSVIKKNLKNLPNSEVKESSEYCLWEPNENVIRRGSSSSWRGSRKDSSQTPSSNSSISKGELKDTSDPDSETGCIRISQESFRLWPDTKFNFRRRACTVAAAESYPRQREKIHYKLSSSPKDRLASLNSATDATSKSIVDGGDYLSPGGINIRRRHNEEYCEYDLSSSAPSAPDSSAALKQHSAQQPTNLRRYTVSKSYFPRRSSSSFSFRGSGKIPSTTNIKSSLSFSERISSSTQKQSDSSSMGEISGVAGSGSEAMTVVQTAAINKETGNQTLSRIKKSIGKLVGRSRIRAPDQDPVSPAPDPSKEVEPSWKEYPHVIQTVADSKQKGLPIIPIPLWGVTTMPKMDTKSEQHKSGESKNSPRFEKSGSEYRSKHSESDRTSTRNLSECSTYSTYSFPASDSSCSLMPDCSCVRCTSNTTSVENSLYILLDQTPSDEGEAFSFERTKSDASSLNTSRPSILKTSPEKIYLPNRRETVSESSGGKQQHGHHLQPTSSNDLQLLNDTLLHTRQNNEPSQPMNYLVMDKRITAIDPILQHTINMNNNLSGYMVMEPGKGIQIIPTSGNINIPQDQYLVMDLNNKSIITNDNNNDYMLMTDQSSAANSNYLSMSQPESVNHQLSASQQIYTMSSNSQLSLTVPSLESIIQPLRSVHSSISQPSLANSSLIGGDVNGPTSLSQPFLNSDNVILNSDGKGEPHNEYMTMDPVSSYMTMGSNTKQTKNNPTMNKSTTNVNNEYVLAHASEGEKVQNKTNNLSVPLELPNFPLGKDYMKMDTPNNIDVATNSTNTSTGSSSTYARSFNALKLSFNKQLIMSKSSNSSSKSQKVSASPSTSKSSTVVATSPTSEPSSLTYQRLSPPVTSSSGHRNSFSQKLSPITRRLPSIKLKSNNNQDRNLPEKAALTTPTVEVDPNGCYLIVDGNGQVLQDVTVLQEVLKDPRIAGAYSSVNCSSVKRKVSFSTRLPGLSQDQNFTSNNEAKPNYMSCGPGSSTGTANQLRSKSMTEDEVEVLKTKLNYFMNVTQENIEYRRHKKANKNKEDYVMVNYPNPPASKPQNIKAKSEKLFLSLSN